MVMEEGNQRYVRTYIYVVIWFSDERKGGSEDVF